LSGIHEDTQTGKSISKRKVNPRNRYQNKVNRKGQLKTIINMFQKLKKNMNIM
jgi:hypothetical protein